MIDEHPQGCVLRVKVVPNASRDQIVGPLGEALKVKVGAAPEGGKANRAVCALLAKATGHPARQVTVIAGLTQANKQVCFEGLGAADLRRLLQTHL